MKVVFLFEICFYLNLKTEYSNPNIGVFFFYFNYLMDMNLHLPSTARASLQSKISGALFEF